MSQSYFTNGSTIGFDPTNMSATALFSVGTHMLGSNDTEWVYVQAQTTINPLCWVAFNSTFSAGMASAGDVAAGLGIALANVTVSASSYGWVAVRGVGMSARFTGTGSTAPTSGQMQLASSGGPAGVMMLGLVGTASCTIGGVALVATASSTAGTASGLGSGGVDITLVNLYWPRQNTP
jgi:hypothetical protein